MLLLQGIHQFLFVAHQRSQDVAHLHNNKLMSQEGQIFAYFYAIPHMAEQVTDQSHSTFHFILIDSARIILTRLLSLPVLQRQSAKNHFKFNTSLGINFVDRENNIKITEMSIILPCSLRGF